MTDKAIMLEITNDELNLLNAAGGDAGKLTHRKALNVFGTGVVYITNVKPKERRSILQWLIGKFH